MYLQPNVAKLLHQAIRNNIEHYNDAAKFNYWFVLVDLDKEKRCAPELVKSWLPRRTSQMILRVAVRSIESWLLADKERIANFLSVHVNKIPSNMEEMDDPKLVMVNLARQSRKREIRGRYGS